MEPSKCVLSDLKMAILEDGRLDSILEKTPVGLKNEVNILRVAIAEFLISQIKPEAIKTRKEFGFVSERLREKHTEVLCRAFF